MARSVIHSTRIGLFVALALAVLCSGMAVAQDKKAAEKAAESKKPAAKKTEEQQPTVKQPAPERSAASRDYKTLKVDESLRKSVSKVSGSLRKGFASGEAATFDKVMNDYILAMWTQPENHSQLSNLRGKLRGQLQSCKSSAPTRKHFNDFFLAKLQEMATDNYHPAVRYNAMLLLGELDEKPAIRVGDSSTPLPAALPVLLKEATNEEQINVVKLAALLGVARHALDLSDADARRDVGNAMSTLATTKSSEGTSLAGQSWMRCIAIDILGILRVAGEQGATAKLLLGIVDDNEDPMRVRVAAARAVGNLTYPNTNNGLDPDTMVRQLGRMAMNACKTEIEKCEETDRTISPRMLKNQLAAVRIGLMGNDDTRDEKVTGGAMSLIKKSEVKTNANAIREKIDRWIGLLDAEELVKKLEPPQNRMPGMGMGMGGPGMGMGEEGMMGMGGPGMGMGGPGMGMGGPGMGMGGPGMGMGGPGMQPEKNEMKIVSDDVIAKIKEDLKDFALLVQ